MIGGADIVISRPVDDDGKGALVRLLLAAWPDAIVEDAETDEAPSPLSRLRASALPAELFVYRDARALDAWEEHGGTDDNVDSMIHVMLGPTTVTCVVDPREGSETRAIAGRIERALEGLEPPMIRGPVFEGLDDPSSWIEAA